MPTKLWHNSLHPLGRRKILMSARGSSGLADKFGESLLLNDEAFPDIPSKALRTMSRLIVLGPFPAPFDVTLNVRNVVVAIGKQASDQWMEGDHVCWVDGMEVRGGKSTVGEALDTSRDVHEFVVQRMVETDPCEMTFVVRLMCPSGQGLGLGVNAKSYINEVFPNGAAALDRRIEVGDQLCIINGVNVENGARLLVDVIQEQIAPPNAMGVRELVLKRALLSRNTSASDQRKGGRMLRLATGKKGDDADAAVFAVSLSNAQLPLDNVTDKTGAVRHERALPFALDKRGAIVELHHSVDELMLGDIVLEVDGTKVKGPAEMRASAKVNKALSAKYPLHVLTVQRPVVYVDGVDRAGAGDISTFSGRGSSSLSGENGHHRCVAGGAPEASPMFVKSKPASFKISFDGSQPLGLGLKEFVVTGVGPEPPRGFNVIVGSVEAGSVAAQRDLRPGVAIVAINGHPIYTGQDAQRVLQATATTMREFTFVDFAQTGYAVVKPPPAATAPANAPAASLTTPVPNSFKMVFDGSQPLGLGLKQFGKTSAGPMPPYGCTVIVGSVEPGSVAAHRDLRPGVAIVAINGQTIWTGQDAQRVLQATATTMREFTFVDFAGVGGPNAAVGAPSLAVVGGSGGDWQEAAAVSATVDSERRNKKSIFGKPKSKQRLGDEDGAHCCAVHCHITTTSCALCIPNTATLIVGDVPNLGISHDVMPRNAHNLPPTPLTPSYPRPIPMPGYADGEDAPDWGAPALAPPDHGGGSASSGAKPASNSRPSRKTTRAIDETQTTDAGMADVERMKAEAMAEVERIRAEAAAAVEAARKEMHEAQAANAQAQADAAQLRAITTATLLGIPNAESAFVPGIVDLSIDSPVTQPLQLTMPAANPFLAQAAQARDTAKANRP